MGARGCIRPPICHAHIGQQMETRRHTHRLTLDSSTPTSHDTAPPTQTAKMPNHVDALHNSSPASPQQHRALTSTKASAPCTAMTPAKIPSVIYYQHDPSRNPQQHRALTSIHEPIPRTAMTPSKTPQRIPSNIHYQHDPSRNPQQHRALTSTHAPTPRAAVTPAKLPSVSPATSITNKTPAEIPSNTEHLRAHMRQHHAPP